MTNPTQKVPVLGANYLPMTPASDDLKERPEGEPVSFIDPKGDPGLIEKLQVLTDAMTMKTGQSK